MKIAGCYLYFREGNGLVVDIGVLPDQETAGFTKICRVYLYTRDGDIRPVRRAVTTMRDSLNDWLMDPANMVEGPEPDGPVNARQVKEGDVMFPED